MLQIKAFYPNFYSDDLISYVSLRIIKYFNNEEVSAKIMGITSDKTVTKYKKVEQCTTSENVIGRSVYEDAIPLFLWKVYNKILPYDRIVKIAEKKFLKKLKKTDVVYLWPGTTLRLYRKIKSVGCVIVTEMINTMQSTSRRILDAEFNRLNLNITHGISKTAADHDSEVAKLSDYIFSPSPAVTQSIIDANIDKEKIIPVSYGLRNSDILEKKDLGVKSEPPIFLFVGQICVRKGIHLLLEAWEKAKIKGTLQIVGRVSDEIKDILQKHLNNSKNIEHVNYVNDLRPIYRDADCFILPSLEEGSPLVTYLALGASLPTIVSPMGAGGIIANGVEGTIVNPHNINELTNAIITLANNQDMKASMGDAAREKSFQYTWKNVSEKRLNSLVQKINF